MLRVLSAAIQVWEGEALDPPRLVSIKYLQLSITSYIYKLYSLFSPDKVSYKQLKGKQIDKEEDLVLFMVALKHKTQQQKVLVQKSLLEKMAT